MGTNTRRRVTLSYDADPSPEAWELREELVPESRAHELVCRLLLAILERWSRGTGRSLQVGRNLAVRWDADRPRVGVDPDVYVVEPVPPEGDAVSSLCTWKPGHAAPLLAVEVESPHYEHKDYVVAPEKYAASGTTELWVFDPTLSGAPSRGGPFRLQVWHRDERGDFRRAYAGPGPALSRVLEAWLVVQDDGATLRLADDAQGTRLWPTGEEQERAAKEQERAARVSLEAELATLREALAKAARG